MISDATRDRWHRKAAYLANRRDQLTEWELGLLASVEQRLAVGRDITMQQSISLTETYDRVQRKSP